MDEQAARSDATAEHVAKVQGRLAIIHEQHRDLPGPQRRLAARHHLRRRGGRFDRDRGDRRRVGQGGRGVVPPAEQVQAIRRALLQVARLQTGQIHDRLAR